MVLPFIQILQCSTHLQYNILYPCISIIIITILRLYTDTILRAALLYSATRTAHIRPRTHTYTTHEYFVDVRNTHTIYTYYIVYILLYIYIVFIWFHEHCIMYNNNVQVHVQIVLQHPLPRLQSSCTTVVLRGAIVTNVWHRKIFDRNETDVVGII